MFIRAIGTNVYKNNLKANSLNFTSRKTGATNPYSTKEYDPKRASSDIRKALEVLGDKKLQLIMHNASAPSEVGKDVGVGSLYSESSKKLLVPFLKDYGFTEIQVDPEGLRPDHDPSPYVSNSFAYNPLMIDLEDLTKPENGSLLDVNVYKTIIKLNPAKGKSNGDYEHSRDSFDIALTNAWKNFKSKSSNPDLISNPQEAQAIRTLSDNFALYKQENGDMLEPYAIYTILTDRFNNDYYRNWPTEYQNLYNPRNEQLISQIKEKHQDDIDKFVFVDMLAKQARDKGVEVLAKSGISTIGDIPVGFSHQEVWAHQDAFLKDYKIGCPPDQGWGFVVYNPAKIFNNDGSLGPFGQLLYDKCKKLAQDNKGGIRIDHIVGLIDPYVYKNSPVEPTAGRLFSSEHNPELRQFAIPRGRHDTTQRFGAILEKIVIPACEEAGLTKDNLICENLGLMPDHARDVFYRLNLAGMLLTRYDNPRNARANDVVMIGSHDHTPLISYVDSLYGEHGDDRFNHALWPAVENTLPRNASHDQKQKVFDEYRFDYNWQQPDVNKRAFMEMKFAELLTSPAKRVQIFWTDLLGINQIYNNPGTSSGNWTLRMSSDFNKQFNPEMLIKSLSIALKAQDEKTVRENQDLINSLDANAQALSQMPNGSKLNLHV